MRRCLACLIMVCLFSLSIPSHAEENTLPIASQPYSAPQGLDDMRYQADLPIYLPSLDDRSLLATPVTFTLPRGQLSARTLVNAVLMQDSDSRVHSLGRETELHLYGRMPVEVAGGVCTVNLDSSALSLDQEDLYTVALCLAATLDGVHDIHAVNLLVADRAIGLDVADYLPCGTVIPRSGVELPVLWEQMRTRATPLGQNPAQVPLSINATLYFPMQSTLGIMPEVRTIAFEGQTPAALASGLLDALSVGAFYLPLAADYPQLSSLLQGDIEVSELTGGGRLLTLRFQPQFEDRLTLMGLRPINVFAAMVTTLTTFIPSVGAVRVFSGNTLITSIYDDEYGMLTFDEGLQYRRQYQEFLRGTATIYLVEDGFLTEGKRCVETGVAQSIPTLLRLMSEGVSESEQLAGLTSAVPPGLDESDVLGMSVVDDTLLLNLSPRCKRMFLSVHQEQELMLCYSLITTFCEAVGVNRIRFFFDSEVPEALGGDIYWGGIFYLNHSLINQNRG